MIGNPVNLIIVYQKDTKKHAEYLRDLIGLRDDTADSVVGLKDGSVKAVIFEDKEFYKNEKNNTSEQKVVYIGNCKGSESLRDVRVRRKSPIRGQLNQPISAQ